VVVVLEIVVNGLRHMERPQFVAVLAAHLVDDAAGVGAVVAADVEEVADVLLLERREDAFAILRVRFVTAGAERRGRRAGDAVQFRLRKVLQLDVVVLDDAGDTVDAAEDFLDARLASKRLDDADERLIDDGGRTTRLPDDNITAQCM